MSTVTSCTLLSGRPAAAAALARPSIGGKESLPCFQKKSRPLSVCFANNPKGEHGPKTDLPPFNISPVALVHHPVSPREERWQMEEKANAVNMWFEVPGLSKEDLVVELDEDVLVIRKKARAEQHDVNLLDNYRTGGRETTVTTGAAGGAASHKDSSRDKMIASNGRDARKAKADTAENHGGVYARLLVPAGYSKEFVEAELASGVLRVTIAKVKEHARRRINVDIHVM